ncbi:hypothetical protein DIPPA_14341 [Diplonema papillatum]|nr:hypothetical protein DIPPA_14341 [Diplonema papillatum]KAJ9460981.1 hypothetical protein DIPPA_14341 [Diplonema papillatum]
MSLTFRARTPEGLVRRTRTSSLGTVSDRSDRASVQNRSSSKSNPLKRGANDGAKVTTPRRSTSRTGSLGPKTHSLSSTAPSAADVEEIENHVEKASRTTSEAMDSPSEGAPPERSRALARPAPVVESVAPGTLFSLQMKVEELQRKNEDWASLHAQLKKEYCTALEQWEGMEQSVKKTQEALGQKRRDEIRALEGLLKAERERFAEESRDHQAAAQELRNELRHEQNAQREAAREADHHRAQNYALQRRLDACERELDMQQTIEAQKRELALSHRDHEVESLAKALEDERLQLQHQVQRFKQLKERYLHKRDAHRETCLVLSETSQELMDLKYHLQNSSYPPRAGGGREPVLLVAGRNSSPPPPHAGIRLHSPSLGRHDGHSLGSSPGSSLSRPLRPGVRSRSLVGSRIRWASESPPPLRCAVPFCATVKAATPPLPLLDNGPTKHLPLGRDGPAKPNSFRAVPPPPLKAYVTDGLGKAVLHPISRIPVPTVKNSMSYVVATPDDDRRRRELRQAKRAWREKMLQRQLKEDEFNCPTPAAAPPAPHARAPANGGDGEKTSRDVQALRGSADGSLFGPKRGSKQALRRSADEAASELQAPAHGDGADLSTPTTIHNPKPDGPTHDSTVVQSPKAQSASPSPNFHQSAATIGDAHNATSSSIAIQELSPLTSPPLVRGAAGGRSLSHATTATTSSSTPTAKHAYSTPARSCSSSTSSSSSSSSSSTSTAAPDKASVREDEVTAKTELISLTEATEEEEDISFREMTTTSES